MTEPITIVGELIYTFDNFNDWVNNASKRIGGIRSRHDVLLCIDSEGHNCNIGEDFMAARDGNRFPVKAYLLKRSIFRIPPNNAPSRKLAIICEQLLKHGYAEAANQVEKMEQCSQVYCFTTPDKCEFYFVDDGNEGIFLVGFDFSHSPPWFYDCPPSVLMSNKSYRQK